MRDRHVGNLGIPVVESGIVADNGVHSGEAKVAESGIWGFDVEAVYGWIMIDKVASQPITNG
jgi:hypothetical protein